MSTTIEYLGRTEHTNPKAISRVSPSVVRLTYHEGAHKSQVNGTIFSCKRDDDDRDQFISYILTTSDLFDTPQRDKTGVSPTPKIDVSLPTDELYEGEVIACDVQLSIVVVKVKSRDELPVATLTPFTDWISLYPSGASESHAAFCLSPYPTKLAPGDELTIVSTLFSKTCCADVVSGIYSVDRIGRCLDTDPFLRINSRNVTNGSPVINCEGDVIGLAFNFLRECVAFLPINIFFKWWKHVLTYGEITRPWVGCSIANLYVADIEDLESVVHDCDVYDGVLIDQVDSECPAQSADMRSNDVIYQCDGRPVRSLLEFFEVLWDKSGEVIEVKGVRNGCHIVWKLEIESIKGGILPKWLSLAEPVVENAVIENVATRKKSTKRGKNKAKDHKKAKKDKEGTRLKARTKKRNSDSIVAAERKKGRWDLSKCSNT